MHFNSPDKNHLFSKKYLKSENKITRAEITVYKLESCSVKNKH